MPKNVSQSKNAKKWHTDANFQTHASTGRKVEMARANVAKGLITFMTKIHMLQKPDDLINTGQIVDAKQTPS